MVTRTRILGAAVAVAVLGVAAFLWFRPDKAFTDTRVDQSLPAARADADESEGRTAPHVLSMGPFRSLEHETTGVAKVVEVASGETFIRLEDFETSAGPDVVVTLSDTGPDTRDAGAYDDAGFVILGPLQGNVGNQNYALPKSIDLSRYESVVIWCRRFNVAFGAAPLSV